VRTLAPLLAACLLCSCSALEGGAPDPEALKADVRQGTERVASATVRGAEAVGDSVGVAYRGVKTGYAEPRSDSYGPFPRDYVSAIRKHMLRFGGVKETASFQFGKPVRAYLNKGLLRGGDIEWQGWVVDLSIEGKTALGQPEVDEYVVRVKDGEIVEVIEKAYASALGRVSSEDAQPAPASRATAD
jgi:hypothetical protein